MIHPTTYRERTMVDGATKPLDVEIERLRARVAELESLLTEAVNEMEPDIEAKYANAHGYPSMDRKYEQDMDLPRRIRAAIAGKEGE